MKGLEVEDIQPQQALQNPKEASKWGIQTPQMARQQEAENWQVI